MILIDSEEYQKTILDLMYSEEVGKMLSTTIYKDDEHAREIFRLGMGMASLNTCRCQQFLIKKEANQEEPIHEWVYADTVAGKRYYRCPNCIELSSKDPSSLVETLADEDEAKWWRFCPRCGVKMFTKR